LPGKPTARKAQLPGGNRMTEKRTPAAERQREAGADGGPSARRPGITGRIPSPVLERESVLTRSGEPVKEKMTKAPEPKDKLDAATSVAVNGLEGEPSTGTRSTGVRSREAYGVFASGSSRGLLEPDARKRARPVLRGAGRSNASGLPVPSGHAVTVDDGYCSRREAGTMSLPSARSEAAAAAAGMLLSR
jgi:hypothetical protein